MTAESILAYAPHRVGRRTCDAREGGAIGRDRQPPPVEQGADVREANRTP